ncbi:hypothetical protein C0992_012911, partial [Termitomyces sp. T32_za158]
SCLVLSSHSPSLRPGPLRPQLISHPSSSSNSSHKSTLCSIVTPSGNAPGAPELTQFIPEHPRYVPDHRPQTQKPPNIPEHLPHRVQDFVMLC